MGASRRTRRRKGIRDRERRFTEKGNFFSENAFLHLQKLQKLRALCALRALRALRVLRAFWFQWFALVFSSRRCSGLSLQLIVLLRPEANFEFQKCAVTSPRFRRYRV